MEVIERRIRTRLREEADEAHGAEELKARVLARLADLSLEDSEIAGPVRMHTRLRGLVPVLAVASVLAVVAAGVVLDRARTGEGEAEEGAAALPSGSSSSSPVPSPAAPGAPTTYSPAQLEAAGDRLLQASHAGDVPGIVFLAAHPDRSGLVVHVPHHVLEEFGTRGLEATFSEFAQVRVVAVEGEEAFHNGLPIRPSSLGSAG